MHPKPLSLSLFRRTFTWQSQWKHLQSEKCTRYNCQPQRMCSSGTLRGPGSQRSQVRVCLCSQQYSLQLGPPSSNSVWAALSVRRRGSHRITRQLGAFAAQSSTSLEDQRSHGHSTALRLLRFPSRCSHPWFRRTLVVTYCMRASHADVYPELLQDTREPGDHVQDGAPHLGCSFVVLLHPVVELRDLALPCLRSPPACSRPFAMCTGLHGAVWFWLPPYLQQNGWNGWRCQRLFEHVTIIALHQSTRRSRTSVWAWRQVLTLWPFLRCAFCGSSVCDLCMAVQHVPVPGPPALSMMAFTVQLRSLHRFRSRQDPRLQLSESRVPRQAFWQGPCLPSVQGPGEQSPPPTGFPRTILLASFSIATLACSSPATPDTSRSAFAARAAAISGVHLAHLSVQCFTRVRHYCLV